MVSDAPQRPSEGARVFGKATPVDGIWLPTASSRSPVNLTTAEQTQSGNDWEADEDAAAGGDADDEGEEGFGDDFDEFAEGEEAADDDFGDFDEGIAAPTAAEPAPTRSLPPAQSAIVSRLLLSASMTCTSNAMHCTTLFHSSIMSWC